MYVIHLLYVGSAVLSVERRESLRGRRSLGTTLERLVPREEPGDRLQLWLPGRRKLCGLSLSYHDAVYHEGLIKAKQMELLDLGL